MNKTAIKNYAIWARRKLIADITYTAGLIGITERGIADPLPQSTKDMQFFDVGTKEYTSITKEQISQRDALVNAIESKAREIPFKDVFQYIVEEVAYTWFNRLIAIRFMEVNDYLPSRIRVLSSDIDGKIEPDFVTKPFDTDLDFTPYEKDVVFQLKEENKLDELFRMLFVKQCNKLNGILPGLFEVTSDYTELLLTLSFTDQDGVVYKLIHDISEDDFNVSKEGQVEIIGWMYQYYNTEPKDLVFANLKKNIKITKDNIPAATQLFTPDWIVRYMVENSLGRVWIEKLIAEGSSKTEKELAEDFGWKYYLEEAEQESEVAKQLVEIRKDRKGLTPEDLRVIDPCMGSGHILVYAFDVLMQIYTSAGYTERDAAKAIIDNNIYGLDIDDRAYQLSYFAVMMKARQYSRRIFNENKKPKVYAIDESNEVNRNQLKYFGAELNDIEKNSALSQMTDFLDNMKDAKEYGSIIQLPEYDWSLIRKFAESYEVKGQINFDSVGVDETRKILLKLINIGQVLGSKYHTVITNPPYMGSSGMSAKLSEYVKKEFSDSKSDLFSVFIEQCKHLTKVSFYQAMITQHSWMFLSGYEKLRAKLVVSPVSLIHLGARAFEEIAGEVVQTASYIFRNVNISGYVSYFSRLVDENSQISKEYAFLDRKYLFKACKDAFDKIPGIIWSYWISPNVFLILSEADKLIKFGSAKQGLGTSDNKRFLRMWQEVIFNRIDFYCHSCGETIVHGLKWYPYNKAGTYRKWSSINEYIVNYENDGHDIKESVMTKYPYLAGPGFVVKNTDSYFKHGITWNDVSTGTFCARYVPDCFIYADAGPMFFSDNDMLMMGYFNSKVFQIFADIICQGLHYSTGHIPEIPYKKLSNDNRIKVETIAKDSLEKSAVDWDSFEASWNFKKHPLI